MDNPSNRRVADITANTPTLAGSIQLTTNNWVRDFPVDTVAAGEMFCSTTVEPYISRTPNADGTGVEETIVSENSLTIIDSLTVSSSQQNAAFYVFVTIDAVAYDGNIYKKIENGETSATDIPVQALPFGKKDTLPESWEAWK